MRGLKWVVCLDKQADAMNTVITWNQTVADITTASAIVQDVRRWQKTRSITRADQPFEWPAEHQSCCTLQPCWDDMHAAQQCHGKTTAEMDEAAAAPNSGNMLHAPCIQFTLTCFSPQHRTPSARAAGLGSHLHMRACIRAGMCSTGYGRGLLDIIIASCLVLHSRLSRLWCGVNHGLLR